VPALDRRKNLDRQGWVDVAEGSEPVPGDGDFLGVVLATVDGILVVDAGGIIRFANPAAGTVLGRTAEELGGLPFELLLPRPDDLAELDVMRPDGTRAVVEMHVAPIRWTGERVRVVTLRDVTVRADTRRRLQASEERYALSARALNAGLLDWDLDTDRLYSSARLQEMLGLDPVDRVETGGWWLELVHPDDRPSFRAELDDLLEGRSSRLELECRLRVPGRPWQWVHIRALAVREAGRARRCVGSVADIGLRRRQEDALRHSAWHDQLTGLANRQIFLDRLQEAIGRQQRDGRRFAVLFLDLDGFKEVNDLLGHGAGDAVLREVARRLDREVRATDTVARFGGDEFAVLLDNPDGLDTVVATVRRIQGALAAPLNVESRVVSTGASIGIAPGDRLQTDPEAILHQADVAMYRAKSLGRNRFEVFSPFLDAEPTARLRRHAELAEAARAGDLFVRYQPVVDLDDGRIMGFEALLRWRVGPGDVRDAAEFIDLAEETGIVVPVGWDVLRVACRQAAAWRDAGFPVTVAVNLSSRQLAQWDLADQVALALDHAGIDGSALALEITERSALANVVEAAGQLERCRGLGVGVVMDDFGTGYASLSTLHHLPLTGLKIDRSFVERLDRGDRGDIVRAVVSLAADLGLEVVAEGIETPAQQGNLRRLGCGLGQGYLLGAALDADDATRLLQAGPGASPGRAPRS
jgi:diguanylate cyclase (GGDEF)-like protein